MAEMFTLNGIKDGGTFKAAKGTVEQGFVVGLGSAGVVITAGAAPVGFVEQVESFDSTYDVVSVVWHRAYNVTDPGLAVGDYVACDGKGGVQKSTSYLGAMVLAIEDSEACVRIL